MSDLQLDPRAMKVQTVAKVAGVGLVTVVASAAVVVTGASVVVAGTAAIAGLFMVNFLVPLAARSIAVWKQKSMVALTEAFSEETIRDDELKEAERIKTLENDYITSRAELEGAQEELRKQLRSASAEEKEIIDSQVQALQNIITEAEDTLESRKQDLQELQRANKLYVALHRAGKAMKNAQGAERNAQDIQNVEVARAAIKNRMRAAMAGKKIAQMNTALKPKGDLITDILSNGDKK